MNYQQRPSIMRAFGFSLPRQVDQMNLSSEEVHLINTINFDTKQSKNNLELFESYRKLKDVIFFKSSEGENTYNFRFRFKDGNTHYIPDSKSWGYMETFYGGDLYDDFFDKEEIEDIYDIPINVLPKNNNSIIIEKLVDFFQKFLNRSSEGFIDEIDKTYKYTLFPFKKFFKKPLINKSFELTLQDCLETVFTTNTYGVKTFQESIVVKDNPFYVERVLNKLNMKEYTSRFIQWLIIEKTNYVTNFFRDVYATTTPNNEQLTVIDLIEIPNYFGNEDLFTPFLAKIADIVTKCRSSSECYLHLKTLPKLRKEYTKKRRKFEEVEEIELGKSITYDKVTYNQTVGWDTINELIETQKKFSFLEGVKVLKLNKYKNPEVEDLPENPQKIY